MKNVIKKIASIAMAFTLLGTGTAVTKTISPKSDNTLVAQAYIPSQNCNHKYCTRHAHYTEGRWHKQSIWPFWDPKYVRKYNVFCDRCGAPLSKKDFEDVADTPKGNKYKKNTLYDNGTFIFYWD
ncbi:hypothetical protein [Ruminococcus flavefaciens]|uniref:hypothetical protein n=1 Tax=Ruminococcus flavefaciens TaxID=1265 RepID=UPI00048EFAC1|nr:hypothetical protein [Ruminococcus flavefaciens]